MSIQEPAWLKRTRPCPFFSQGRCLFADSCNFLHDVKARSVVNQPLPSTIQVKQSSLHLKSVFDPPSVVVNSASPRSVNLASPESPTSPIQDSSRYSGLLFVLSDVIGPPSNSPIEAEQGTSSLAEPSSILESDPEDTLVDPFEHQMESFFPEVYGELVAEFLPVPDDEESPDGDTTPYFVQDTETYVIGSEFEEEGDDKDMDDCGEEDLTVALSNRQSTLSSFTGASLLASPRDSVFGKSSVASPTEDGAVDLLSPVELSTKLQPFPIPSLDSKVKRGDSIDSGYADGGSWVSPLPFPRSPPRSFRSPVTFLPHSRRASRSSPALQDRRVSYDVSALRPSPHNPIEAIKEVDPDESSEDNEDVAFSILGAYDTSPSEEQGENKACGPLQLNVPVVTEENAEEDDELPEVPADMPSPRRYSLEHLHPTREYDLDSCNQPSDDNLSFKTALSTQPSYADLNDIPKVSPIKHDSLLSSVSGCSTPNTSVLSHYGDENGLLEQPTVNSHVRKPCLVATTGVVASREHSPVILHYDWPSPKSSSSTEGSYNSSSYQDVLDYAAAGGDVQEPAPENVVAPQERLSSVLHFDKPSAKLGSLAESSHNLSSGKDFLVCASPNTDGNDGRSPEPSPTVSYCYLPECGAAEAGQSLVENSLGPDEITESFDSECDDPTQRLSFPLPPPFFPAEIVGHSTFSGEEDTSVLSEAAAANLEMDVSNACTVLQHEEVQQILSGPDLTEKARQSQLPSVGSPDSDSDFTLRRSRAASDLTVKGRSSPVATPGGTPYISRSSSPPVEQPGRSDPVQSLYDQYFDDGTSDDDLEFSSPAHRDTTLPDVSSPTEEPSQDVHLRSVDHTSHVFHRVSSPISESKTSNSGTDSPWSGNALRPLWTGRRSFLFSSLTELVPKANPFDAFSSPPHPSTRLQDREIGSTMVPLGFRRHKPQPAAIQSSRIAPQALDAVLPASQLREVLRIRTDIAKEDSPPECSSALHASFTTRSPLPVKPMSAPPTGGLKQLHLSSIIKKRSSILSSHSSSIASSILSLDHTFNSSTPQSPSVSSTTSFSRNSSFSSSCERIPEQIHHTPKRTSSNSPILQAADDACSVSHSSSTRRDSRSVSAPIQQPKSWRLSHYRAGSRNYTSADSTHRLSRRTSTLSLSCVVDEEQEIDEHDSTISRPIQSEHEDDWTCPASVLATPVHAIATPKPTLLFAIASDNVDQVRQVLESGEAGPNDSVGPQSALAFTLTNDKLAHKQEIVKALLAYGANPSALRNPTLNPAPRKEGGDEPSTPPPETTIEGMDPATRYFVARADAAHTRQTSQLIYRSFFRPLTRVRYDVIGQDLALEQLFRVLGMHSQKLAVAPIVVLLCGPSGHGKSLLARKFGSLLDVPTHTVNMTTLRSAHDIWQSYSMSPYEEPSSCTLAEFLNENEGKRCVVVLDEIEKVEDQKALWSLLMPWELGRCSLEAGKRHVDVRNVIWLGTSNVGHELVFEHHGNRAEPDKRMSREEYLELTGMLRPHVSHCLGPSLVSRITAVLPFVPFTLDEKKAIAAEAVYALSGDTSKMLSPQDVEFMVVKALPSYHPSEGARSLHRAISNILVE